MKKLLIVLLCLSLFTGCKQSWEEINVNLDSTIKIQAVWFSYLDYADLFKNKQEESFKNSVSQMFDNLESLEINRLYLHVSMFTDAIWPSEYYAFSSYCAGKTGKNPGYDPLAIIVEEANTRSIDVEAWINPFRSYKKEEIKSLPVNNIIRKWVNDSKLKEKNLFLVDGRYYLNPGSEDVQELIANVVTELETNYEIDGIHIDDYFYPSGLKESADQITYEEYLQEYPDTELSDYRRAMCDAVVSRMYSVIKEIDYNDIFSISPSANIQTNYDSYYADVVKWASTEGYCDVMIPQVYFGFENATMPFEEVVDEWDAIEDKKVRILYGLAAYKVGTEDAYAGDGKYEWVENDNVLSRQIAYIMSKKSYRGFALYRYCSLFFPQKGVRSQMKLELTKIIDMLKTAKS